jgi:hypothetical protein
MTAWRLRVATRRQLSDVLQFSDFHPIGSRVAISS